MTTMTFKQFSKKIIKSGTIDIIVKDYTESLDCYKLVPCTTTPIFATDNIIVVNYKDSRDSYYYSFRIHDGIVFDIVDNYITFKSPLPYSKIMAIVVK